MTTPTPPQSPAGLDRALLDWIVTHGQPLGGFGPGNRLTAERMRADLAARGIDYAASTVGDLGGREWCEDTFDEAAVHPGLWATVVDTAGETCEWFVPGQTYTLSQVILDLLTAP